MCVLFLTSGCPETTPTDPWDVTDCGEHGDKVDGPDGPMCDCDPGYHPDGYTCRLADADADADADAEGDSEDCEPGYEWDGSECVDIDECAELSHDCHAFASCLNTPGSFDCACDPGYTGDGWTCTDIDECLDGTDDCDPLYATCTNTVGSFSCACFPGFDDVFGDGTLCDCSGGGMMICTDECIDTDSDVDNCGDCNYECFFDNATPDCVGGFCVVGSCDGGFFDCDGHPSNGCESVSPCDEEWVIGLGGFAQEAARSIDVDGSGNVYITGSFSGTVDFGGGPLTSAGSDDLFVLHLLD